MNWNDLSPEAKMYIMLQPHLYAKTTISALITLLDKSVSLQEKGMYIDRAADILKMCAKSIQSHPDLKIIVDNTSNT